MTGMKGRNVCGGSMIRIEGTVPKLWILRRVLRHLQEIFLKGFFCGENQK